MKKALCCLLAFVIIHYTQAQSPTITSYTPNRGAVGSLVTITGTNLSSPTGISIGGVSGIAISNTGTSLVAMVMPGATTGAISVTTASGTASGIGNFTLTSPLTPNGQQGFKLEGLDNTGAAQQGWSIAISADGNTAIVGGYNDNSGIGAVWIYTKSGVSWTQQGSKLEGSDNTGAANQGRSVSISADGNTAIVGGDADNTNQGAAWVYTRSGGSWSQQGSKLVGTGNTGAANQGQSVSISADGNTAIVGGDADNTNKGAAWVYIRSGSTWTQQGSKLVGTGAVGNAQQGWSVSISADGNTAIVGGYIDNTNRGAAWIYSRSGGNWSQQGNKLVGTGAVGTTAKQGTSVSISADGNTAIVGGTGDNSNQGAAWIYTRSVGTWTQQGNKLVGTGNTGAAQQGQSVSISADGNTAIVGGAADNTNRGAAWVFARSGSSWTQQGDKLDASDNTTSSYQGQSVCISADGNTAMVGGRGDNTNIGAAWAYTYVGPVITSFSPTSGTVGSLVTITGTNLSSPTAISIGGVPAIAISNTSTSLVAMVMPGATTGTISITTAKGTNNSTGDFTIIASQHPNIQQGNKLVGTGNIGAAQQSTSLAISADGNTAIVGGPTDNTNQGAAWVYTRSGGSWSQQGNKLVGTGAVGVARQGISVSISADGNTAIVGGFSDNTNQGAAWVYTRSGGSWSQQGNKLVGTGNTGAANQGQSVSISADGNTAIVGGFNDNTFRGAAWIFTRSGGNWSQQGNKLVGTGAVGTIAKQGTSVSISADGNTAMVGGTGDNSNQGAAWVFTRTGVSWTQQGSKLVGTGAVGTIAKQGTSVSISADGNTAIVGGSADNTNQGAAWVFTRSGSTWTQQGSKLVGTGAVGNAQQGQSVSISADGNTAIVGGAADNSNQGAAWVFARSGSSWTQLGTKLDASDNTTSSYLGQSVSISADGNTAMVGGHNDNSNQGAAWVFTPASPTITSFTPASGSVGSLVTITGTNLNNPTAIIIGGVAVITISNTGTSLVAMVMPGATTGTVGITTGGGSANTVDSFTITASQAPNTQQGNKLVGSGNTGAAQQGNSSAISADGNTAIVGGFGDNTNQGAAWIYTKSGGLWSQQGSKLVGTGAVGVARQGTSVSISADGNTAIVGGEVDNSNQGAVWIYTRSNGIWTQQGNKLVGTGNTGGSKQGFSVSISADGNSAIVGAPNDNSNQGAAWIYTRSDGIWTQQGTKLVGTGAVGAAQQGWSVSISADGNTAIVGGFADNTFKGAAWIYNRSGTTWTQQGTKLVGTGGAGGTQQGWSVSVNADGNTAIVGGWGDDSQRGAAWVYTKSSGIWIQQGSKLVGSGAITSARQGQSVSISADGNTVIVGGNFDNAGQHGAAWIFTRSGVDWMQQGNKLVGTGNTGSARQGQSVSISADGNIAIAGGSFDNSLQGAAWVYTYVTPPPTITSFTPASGTVGSLVTITGTNLNNPTAIIIGGVAVIAISNTGTSLVAMVMPGATTGTVSITTAGGTANGIGNFSVIASQAPNTQQDNKLVGSGNTGAAQQAYSISISADGNTAIVGGPTDNGGRGAAWIYTRSGGSWTQQGNKLVATGNTGISTQGSSVSISADGNTAIVGGSADDTNQGAAWIFTRTGVSWTQQGSKLVGTGNIGAARQGYSVSICADGNTALIGGFNDNSRQGATWVFIRDGVSWTQQGSKLVGTGAVGDAQQGRSVSISADGNTAILGGWSDNINQGAAWVYTRSGGTWTQQGSKLVGTGNIGGAYQGQSVSISADGNTAIVGGFEDNSNQGAAWIYTRSGGSWTQQGSKLVGTGNTGTANQGQSVSISADGNTAIVGGDADDSGQGAAWVYTRNGGSWTQQGSKLVGTGAVGNAKQGWSVSISADGITAIVGGYVDNGELGAAWVYTNVANTLAVSLVSYNARLTSSGTAQLNWVTATETNNNYFEVLRSADGINFTAIGKVTGAGNTTQEKRYNFTDLSPLAGSNYYQLLQYDKDGKRKALGIRLVKVSQKAGGLTIYPNPSNGVVNLNFEANSYQKVELIDLAGKILMTRAIGKQESTMSFTIRNLAAGIYNVKLTGNEKLARKQIVKE